MPLNKQEETALKQFKADLQQVLGNQLIELNLYGSKARGDDRPDSDLDVLVIVATDDCHIRESVYNIVTDILLQTDICISPKIISKDQFDQLRKENTSFIRNVSRDALTV